MCASDRIGGWQPPVTRPVIVGEEGFFLMRYIGPEITEPYHGDYTGAEYKFHTRRLLYVDKRDAVYFLGPDFEMEQ